MYKIYADGELLCDSRIDELALISPNGSLAANVAGEFSFAIPSTHPKYNLIKIKSTVIRIFRDDEKNPMMEAIAVSESIDFFKNRTIQCEGALSFLNDTILRPSLRNGYTVEQLLTAYINEHNAQVGQKKKFRVGRITVSTSNLIYTSTNMTSTFAQIKSDLLDDLGGYMMVRYEGGERFIDYLATAVETCEQKIELGKNLLDYKSNIDSENFATRVIPLGATLEDSQQSLEGVSQRLTISSVNGGRDFVCNTEAEKDHDVTAKTIVFDDVTDPEELMAKGDAYLRSIQFRNVYIEAKAIDFGYLTNKIQKFSLLKRVNVLSSAHGLDGYFMLTKQDFELNSPENDVFVFGSTEAAKMQSSKTLSAKSQETIHEVENQIEEIHEDVGGLKVTLEKTDEGLLAEVTRAQGAENTLSGRISLSADEINAEIARAMGAESSLSSRITLTESSIEQEVSRAIGAENTISASLSLKIDKTDNGQIISMINGAADRINFNANNLFTVNSPNFTVDSSGKVSMTNSDVSGKLTASSGKIGPFTIGAYGDYGDALYNTSGTMLWENTVATNYLEVIGIGPYKNRSKLQITGTVDVGDSGSVFQVYSSIKAPGIKNRTSTKTANIRLQDGSEAWLAYITSSSERYKHFISDITQEELLPERLYNLPTRQYIYNDNYLDCTDQRYEQFVCGLIAEEVSIHYPVAAEFDEWGRPENWNERYLIPPMLALIQSQHKEIETMKPQIFSLQMELDFLKQEMEDMKNA